MEKTQQPLLKKEGLSTGVKVGLGFGIGCLVIIILVVAGCVKLGSSVTKDVKKQEVEKQEKLDKPTAKIGDKIVAGNFEFKVNKVEEKTAVGGSEFSDSKKAQGIFKLIEVEVKNNNKETKYLDSSMFKLKDSKGQEFTVSTDAMTAFEIYEAGGESQFFLQQIQPSLSKTGIIIFDVPKDTTNPILIVSGGFLSSEKASIKLEK